MPEVCKGSNLWESAFTRPEAHPAPSRGCCKPQTLPEVQSIRVQCTPSSSSSSQTLPRRQAPSSQTLPREQAPPSQTFPSEQAPSSQTLPMEQEKSQEKCKRRRYCHRLLLEEALFAQLWGLCCPQQLLGSPGCSHAQVPA
ncbi:hypothetical protein EK904_004133 [Melospiza melodia maxima]|nr:hypothetical protein EK904_004133 [Melospiza melodia maxima]